MAKGSGFKSEAPQTSPPQEEFKSPPSPPPSDSNSPSPPYSDTSSDSKPDSFPPPPPSDSSPPSPPPPSTSPPPPTPTKSDNDKDRRSSPSPPSPPDSYSTSSGSPPPKSPPPTSPSEQSPPSPASSDSGNSGGEDGGSTPPSFQQSPPTAPVDGGTPADVVQSGVIPSTNLNPALPHSPPASSNNQSSSSLRPPVENQRNGEGPPALPSSTSSSSSYSNSSSSSAPVTIIVGVIVGGLLLLLFAVVLICTRKKKKKEVRLAPPGHYGPTVPQGNQYCQATPQGHTVNIPPHSSISGYNGDHSGLESGANTSSNAGLTPGGYGLGFSTKSTFSYEELATATSGFNQSNMLGQGGFGYVHKGVLPDGKMVAVKSLKSGSGQGEREFQAEVEIISRVHHRHLVSLVGYCIAREQRMLRVALGSAKGLAYLHEDCHPRIIHRDIKASNILLDENFEAMVADFGLAKLTSDTNTHVSTRVMGTFGYLAPEYASSGKLTEKSDVFSFGVMLLELITGRRPVDPKMQYMEDSLVDWSRPLLTKALETNNYDGLVDPRLKGNYNSQDIQRMVACAAASIRHSAKKRPKMSQIVRVLEGDVSLEDLNEGVKPGQSSVYNTSDGSSEYDPRTYSADLKRFRQIAFASQEITSSEYGGSTSEYGLDPSSSSSSGENSRELKS